MASFSHIAVNVSELSRSVAFYRRVLAPLSFAVADVEPSTYARLSNGRDAVIVLAQAAPQYMDRGYHRKAVGLAHFALAVDSRQEFVRMLAHLQDLGIPFLGTGPVEAAYRGGYHTFSFEDPDRIMIEIVHHPALYFSLDPP